MPTILAVTLVDDSKETSTVSFFLPDVAADGTNWAAILSARAAILAAVDAVTEGYIKEHHLLTEATRLTNSIPTDGDREAKLQVSYQDNVTLKPHTLTIPCRDKSAFTWSPGTDFVDLGASSPTSQTDFIAAFNGNVKSPAGNAVTIFSMEKVGRNL